MRLSRVGTVALATTVVASLALVGCAADVENPPGTDDLQAACDISFLTFQSPALTEEFWNEQVAAVKKIYPNLNVDIQYTPGLDRKAYASQLLAAGTLPDVIWQVSVPEFVKAGALLPYDISDVEKTGAAPDSAKIDGKFYTLSVGSQPKPMMFYNIDKFDALNLTIPTTFRQLEDVAAKLKAAGEIPFLAGGGSDPWTSTMLLGGIINTDVYAANPNWLQDRKKGEVSFTDPLFKNAVQKWAELVKKGYLNDDALGLNYAQLIAKFVNGEGAMYPMGGWAAATKADFNIGVFALPTEDGKSTILGDSPSQLLSVSSKTKCPAQAKAFAVALATSPDFASAFFMSDSLIPTLPEWKVPAEATDLQREAVDLFTSDSLTFVDPWGWEQGSHTAPAGFGNEFNKGAQSVISGGSVDEFLTKMDAVFDDLNTAG